jgi:hypothetical protein
MTRRRQTPEPVPLTPSHRRTWRTFWRRCSCGLPAPCIDRAVPAKPRPYPPRPAIGYSRLVNDLATIRFPVNSGLLPPPIKPSPLGAGVAPTSPGAGGGPGSRQRLGAGSGTAPPATAAAPPVDDERVGLPGAGVGNDEPELVRCGEHSGLSYHDRITSTARSRGRASRRSGLASRRPGLASTLASRRRPGLASRQAGVASRRAGSASRLAGSAPRQAGSASRLAGSAPRQAGSDSPRASRQPSPATQRAGLASQRAGVTPRSPELAVVDLATDLGQPTWGSHDHHD